MKAFTIAMLLWLGAVLPCGAGEMVELSGETLRDKIRGGLLGQMLGNLNGLPHEMKYIAESGSVTGYAPGLPDGAWTDDDTDFEWVYILEMQRRNSIRLPEADIANLWRQRINQRIDKFGRSAYVIPIEPAANVAPLLDRADLLSQTRKALEPQIRAGLESSDPRERARAAYLAISLELAAGYQSDSPTRWSQAMEDLRSFDQIAQVLFHHSPVPAAQSLQEKAVRAGLEKPAQRRDLW